MKKNTIFLCLALAGVCMVAIGKTGDAPEGEKTGGDAATQLKLAAEKVRIKCQTCSGKGYVKVSPMDVGQFAGRIEDKSHFDMKLDPCPICGRGHGWRTVWDLTQPEPSTEPPCTSCGWSGLVQCRRCLASGVAKCSHQGCKDGWILTKVQSKSRRSSSSRPPTVNPCPECKGLGKVVCPVCKGMRADLCKRCHGMGRKTR